MKYSISLVLLLSLVACSHFAVENNTDVAGSQTEARAIDVGSLLASFLLVDLQVEYSMVRALEEQQYEDFWRLAQIAVLSAVNEASTLAELFPRQSPKIKSHSAYRTGLRWADQADDTLLQDFKGPADPSVKGPITLLEEFKEKYAQDAGMQDAVESIADIRVGLILAKLKQLLAHMEAGRGNETKVHQRLAALLEVSVVTATDHAELSLPEERARIANNEWYIAARQWMVKRQTERNK
jgi:hypothetical protein